MVRKIKESKIQILLTAVLLTVFFAFSSYAKDFGIYFCWWEDTEDGIWAAWEKAEDATAYRVTLFRDHQPKGSSVSTANHRIEMTDLLLTYGPGTYYFEVYPVKGGEDLTVVSGACDFDVERYAQARREKNRKKKAQGSQKSESAKQEGTLAIRLSAPDGIYLEEGYQLKWNVVENAYRYLLRFYCNGEIIGVQRTDQHGMDISEYLAECTEIRLSAVGEPGHREVISSKPAFFSVEDYCPEGWECRGGTWFYFINGEKCDPGWFEDTDGHKYYFDAKSRMKTGYVWEDGHKYFFNDGTYEDVPYGAYVPER